jgi:hypothetical protein
VNLTPVPRWYGLHGTAFRSSLEADWACTLDHLGIKWEYEPQRLRLPSGAGYIPDFWLPEIGTWIEVKGDIVPGEEKARELAAQRACGCEGSCSCAWPGGEIVLLGRDGRARTWEDALGMNALLGECASCGAWSWLRPRVSLACRKCSARFTGGHLYSATEVGLRPSDRHAWTAVR